MVWQIVRLCFIFIFFIVWPGQDTAIVVLKETFDLQYIVDPLSLHMLSCNLDKDPSGARNPEWWGHGLINSIDTKAKCLNLEKLTCKGTLRQVFIRIYRLVIHPIMLVFSTQLCELLAVTPFTFPLVSSPPPLSVWISIQYTRIQCVRGGQINICHKVPSQVHFLDDDS